MYNTQAFPRVTSSKGTATYPCSKLLHGVPMPSAATGGKHAALPLHPCPSLCCQGGPSPPLKPQQPAPVHTRDVRTAVATPLGSQGDRYRWTGLSRTWDIPALMQMARLHNIVPSTLMTILGAWAGTGRNLGALTSVNVWAMCVISCGVSVASMFVNDYFDYASGVDQVNTPDKPLPSGKVAPDVAVLMGTSIYVGVLMAACLMDSTPLRAIIAFSAGATLLYTPLFKKVTAVKNATVASIVALTPIAGALAAGADLATLGKMLPSTIFAFTGILYREILMDINDAEGDGAAGVRTLPVRFGKDAALVTAAVCVLFGAVAGVWGLLASYSSSAGLAVAGVLKLLVGGGFNPSVIPHVVCIVLMVLATVQLMGQVIRIKKSGYDHGVVDWEVDECRKPIGLMVIMLAAMA